ncbi:MAG TPA: ACP S-malonyltransferase [Planctomycetota bacterium]|nr:ACP S-malonyltransferase [Planctomycetota bacterium]
MVGVAYLFAGQGAQAVGMGKDLAAAFPGAKELFDRASALLGFDLAKVCFEGPAEELNRTDRCQPALLVHGIACLEVAARRGLPPGEAAAGLSLGEYTAHVYAGSLTFEDGVRLLQKRGKYMQEACDRTPSGMVSILGLDREKCALACQGMGDVGVANLNAPGQIVLSGENGALEKAVAKARELGAKRAIPLKVAGAYHSVVMKPAQEQMQKELAAVRISRPRIPVYANVSAKPLTDPEEIRSALATQICSSVLWEDSVRAIGAAKYFEFGPGKVLAGLVRKIDEKAETVSIEGAAS